MEILKANKDKKEIRYLDKNKIYVKITDYGTAHLFMCIKVDFGVETWIWHPLKSDSRIDIKNIKIRSFDQEITKSVYDPYCTVYIFSDFTELSAEWNKLRYVDDSSTVFKSEREND